MINAQTVDRIFHRPELANRLASIILDDSPTSASPSGVFLSAPRRTGKTWTKAFKGP
jgi:hypothetical protein